MGEQPEAYSRWERNFVEQMKRLREARQMTQTDLARELKAFGLPFHQQTIQRIENGERPVRLNEAHLIARIFDVEVESMTADVEPYGRDLLYAVDHLRSVSESRGLELLDSLMADWVEAAEHFVTVLERHIPATAKNINDLELVARWGMAWAVRTGNAYDALLEAGQALLRIGSDRLGLVVSLKETMEELKEKESSAEVIEDPMGDVLMHTLQQWRARFETTEMAEASYERSKDLYAAFPGEA